MITGKPHVVQFEMPGYIMRCPVCVLYRYTVRCHVCDALVHYSFYYLPRWGIHVCDVYRYTMRHVPYNLGVSGASRLLRQLMVNGGVLLGLIFVSSPLAMMSMVNDVVGPGILTILPAASSTRALYPRFLS